MGSEVPPERTGWTPGPSSEGLGPGCLISDPSSESECGTPQPWK